MSLLKAEDPHITQPPLPPSSAISLTLQQTFLHILHQTCIIYYDNINNFNHCNFMQYRLHIYNAVCRAPAAGGDFLKIINKQHQTTFLMAMAFQLYYSYCQNLYRAKLSMHSHLR